MTAVAKIEENYNHIECREDWGDVQDPNSFARRYHAHKLWLKDKNQEGAARFVCKVGEVLPENLTGVDLRKADLIYANLKGAKLVDAKLAGANLLHANLLHANLRNANMTGANLRNTNLTNANLEDAYLINANLRDANLRNANMTGANLRNTNLTNANLEDAYLINANLRDANLRDANLRDANLRDAYLEGANLTNANLRDAYLRNANLKGANLINAGLRDANLTGVKLTNTNLRDAYLEDANLKNVEINLVSLKSETKLWNDALLAGAILHDNGEYLTEESSREIIKQLAKEHGINARLGGHPALVPAIAIAAAAVGATILALAVVFNNGSAPDEKTSTQPVDNNDAIPEEIMCADGGAREHSTVNAVCRKLGL